MYTKSYCDFSIGTLTIIKKKLLKVLEHFLECLFAFTCGYVGNGTDYDVNESSNAGLLWNENTLGEAEERVEANEVDGTCLT